VGGVVFVGRPVPPVWKEKEVVWVPPGNKKKGNCEILGGPLPPSLFFCQGPRVTKNYEVNPRSKKWGEG